MASLSDDAKSFTFTQFAGIHVLGSIQGVLPIGPNGIPIFNTLPLAAIPASTTYNYTLELQGLTSSIACSYDTESPIVLVPTASPSLSNYSGSCPPGKDILVNPLYPTLTDSTSLGFWACLSSENSYVLYLRGYGDYSGIIGNITCSVSSAQLAIFFVTYSKQNDLFTLRASMMPTLNISTTLMQLAVIALGDVISRAQLFQSNLLAESVIALGVQNFGLPSGQSGEYLQLYEAMIDGLLKYEVRPAISYSHL